MFAAMESAIRIDDDLLAAIKAQTLVYSSRRR